MSMKLINNYIIEKLKLNNDIELSSDDLKDEIVDRDDEITKDFRKLYKMIYSVVGNDNPILDSLCSMSDFNEDFTEFYYEFDENKWAIFLRDIVNYDLISLGKNGAINVNDSNHKDIAKLVKKWNRLPIGKRVYDSFR